MAQPSTNPNFDKDKNYSESDYLKALNDHVGRKDQYEVRVVESTDGRKQTQVLDKDTGSISVAAWGEGSEAFNRLMAELGTMYLDPAVAPKEAVEDNKVEYTSRGARMTPTMPEAIEADKDPVEVNPKEDRKEQGVENPTNQQSRTDRDDQKSQPDVKRPLAR